MRRILFSLIVLLNISLASAVLDPARAFAVSQAVGGGSVGVTLPTAVAQVVTIGALPVANAVNS